MKILSCPNPDCRVGSFTGKYCRECGKALVDAPLRLAANFHCPNCDASVLRQDKFCQTCGHKLPIPCFAVIFKRFDMISCFFILTDDPAKSWDVLAKERDVVIDLAERQSAKIVILEVPSLFSKKGK